MQLQVMLDELVVFEDAGELYVNVLTCHYSRRCVDIVRTFGYVFVVPPFACASLSRLIDVDDLLVVRRGNHTSQYTPPMRPPPKQSTKLDFP